MTYEFDGLRAIAMNGGTIGHERIQNNLKFALMGRLRGGRCEPFGPNTRVPTGRGRYRFPDVLVTCSTLDPAALDVTEPVVIFEILSNSTSRTDRGEKLVEYRGLASLVHYVMVDQAARLVTVITRGAPHWGIEVYRNDESVALPEIGVELPLDEIYTGLTFPPDPFEDGDPPR